MLGAEACRGSNGVGLGRQKGILPAGGYSDRSVTMKSVTERLGKLSMIAKTGFVGALLKAETTVATECASGDN